MTLRKVLRTLKNRKPAFDTVARELVVRCFLSQIKTKKKKKKKDFGHEIKLRQRRITV